MIARLVQGVSLAKDQMNSVMPRDRSLSVLAVECTLVVCRTLRVQMTKSLCCNPFVWTRESHGPGGGNNITQLDLLFWGLE